MQQPPETGLILPQNFTGLSKGRKAGVPEERQEASNLLRCNPFSINGQADRPKRAGATESNFGVRRLPLIWWLIFAFDLRLDVFDSHLFCNASAISLSASIVGRGQPERMLRGKDSRRVQSVERGGLPRATRQARGARLHIELSRSMRDRRDGFSRTRSLFLRAGYSRGRPRDCGWTRKGQPVKRLVLTADQA